MTTSDRVIELLQAVSETDEVQKKLDIPLYVYDLQVLDSLRTVKLIVILYHLAVIARLLMLCCRGNFSAPPFIYQGF